MRAYYQRIPLTANESFLCRRLRVRNFLSLWHFHSEYELTLIITARGMRYVGDSVERFDDGDLLLLGCNLPHVWWKDKEDRRMAEAVVIQFSADFLGADWLHAPEARSIAALLTSSSRGLSISGTTREQVADGMREINAMKPWNRLLALLTLLGTLAANHRKNRPLATTGYQPRLQPQEQERMGRVCNYINANYADEVSQPEAASIVGITPAAFSRFFFRHAGKTFEEYVNEIRIGQACWKLHVSDSTISEIAFAVGFSNLSNFNRRFREIKGVTPREFRREMPVGK
ncbi:MAG: AraC family transcriptional regulator [Chthoniobacterales bacterium]